MAEKALYEVTVGNIGHVYTGPSGKKARADFAWYVKQSKLGVGRAAGEQVTLCKDGEPIKEHFPPPAYDVRTT